MRVRPFCQLKGTPMKKKQVALLVLGLQALILGQVCRPDQAQRSSGTCQTPAGTALGPTYAKTNL